MNHEEAKRRFLMLPFLVLTVVGAVLVLYAPTAFGVEGKGTVFYNPRGTPGIIAIIVGLAGLLLLRLSK